MLTEKESEDLWPFTGPISPHCWSQHYKKMPHLKRKLWRDLWICRWSTKTRTKWTPLTLLIFPGFWRGNGKAVIEIINSIWVIFIVQHPGLNSNILQSFCIIIWRIPLVVDLKKITTSWFNLRWFCFFYYITSGEGFESRLGFAVITKLILLSPTTLWPESACVFVALMGIREVSGTLCRCCSPFYRCGFREPICCFHFSDNVSSKVAGRRHQISFHSFHLFAFISWNKIISFHLTADPFPLFSL